MSCTVTVKLAVDVLPCASVDEQETVVTPSGNVEPDAGLQLTGSVPSTASVAETLYVTTAPLGPVASTVRLPGVVIAGGVVSCTVMLKLAVPVLPCVSWEEHVTVVVPSGNVSPELWSQVGTLAASSGSVALTEKVATAPFGPVASTVKSAGTLTVGGVVSAQVTVAESHVVGRTAVSSRRRGRSRDRFRPCRYSVYAIVARPAPPFGPRFAPRRWPASGPALTEMVTVMPTVSSFTDSVTVAVTRVLRCQRAGSRSEGEARVKSSGVESAPGAGRPATGRRVRALRQRPDRRRTGASGETDVTWRAQRARNALQRRLTGREDRRDKDRIGQHLAPSRERLRALSRYRPSGTPTSEEPDSRRARVVESACEPRTNERSQRASKGRDSI